MQDEAKNEGYTRWLALDQNELILVMCLFKAPIEMVERKSNAVHAESVMHAHDHRNAKYI